jgi:tartrate dehydrogenase/decarboxylase/D-malate dehydrogenase
LTDLAARTVAVIPGDGIGPEVVEVAEQLMVTAAAQAGVALETVQFNWGAAYYRQHGRPMPETAAQQLREFDAVLFGAFGDPDLPDHEVVWGLIELRKQMDLAANLRPVATWPGVPTPFLERIRADFLVVRENTEGEYSGIGGRTRLTGIGDVAIAVAVHSEQTIAQLARYAFGLARGRRSALTLIGKANAIHHAFSLWDEVVGKVALEFPDVAFDRCLVDAAVARMVQRPESFDVVLCSNLFGDVLSELGSTLQGGLGTAAGANVRTDGGGPGLFEPIHGSAPDLAGRGIANPSGAILCAAMLLEHIGVTEASERLREATRQALGDEALRTADLGGRASTREFGAAVALALNNGAASGSSPALPAADAVTTT